ncbi:hypothetical protein J2045_001993 [Peteryoungia aggregata LMG 23059]|uniref:Uncharacterized protein n=1 Tax=Peteryoungia aggregata LMG 23059 TaxID=1368425 RepID=A0ABU0G885_9HYPH|nr:hypothetical protein [Peteryoungia aggregata]MDQ0420966.1 hypothetical protein [Peteryoungia aggregata LMG 23059]
MGGNTASAHVAEQQRQGAPSIANAKDRAAAAGANYATAGKHTQITAQNDIARQQVSPLTHLTNIATSGINNDGALGSFGKTGGTATKATGHYG